MVENRSRGITVFPNPVAGEQINMQFKNMPSGRYTARLIKDDGQLMLTQQIDHHILHVNEQIKFVNTITRGSFQLEITQPGNSQTTHAIFKL